MPNQIKKVDPLDKAIGEILKVSRDHKKWSQTELATHIRAKYPKMKVTAALVSKYEKGQPMSLKRFVAFCDVLGLVPWKVLKRIGEATK